MRKYFQQSVPTYMEPMQTPLKLQPRKLSPMISQGPLEDDEKQFGRMACEDFMPMPTRSGMNLDFHLTPNYHKMSHTDSPSESQDAVRDFILNEHSNFPHEP